MRSPDQRKTCRCVGRERAVSASGASHVNVSSPPTEPPQASSFLPTTKPANPAYDSRMSRFAWHGQPRGYRKCPVAYNVAAHAHPLSERIVGNWEFDFWFARLPPKMRGPCSPKMCLAARQALHVLSPTMPARLPSERLHSVPVREFYNSRCDWTFEVVLP